MDWHTKYGPWALVTGASSGIGRSFALGAARRGLHVVLAARREERLREVAEACQQHGVETLIVPIDLAQEGAAATLHRACADLEIGLLINNAGFGDFGNFMDLDVTAHGNMVRVNCLMPVQLTSYFLKPMLDRKRGGMVMLSSMVGFKATPHFSLYSATKAFDRWFGAALYDEVKGAGIDVLTICPGLTDTEFFENARGRTRLFPVGKPETVAEEGLRYLGRRRVHVVGWFNKVLVVMMERWVPSRWAYPMVGWVARMNQERGRYEKVE